MVDAVVTWVDGEDPLHKKKRRKYEKLREDEYTHPQANHPTRFSSKDEIWYCLHSIRRFAPYVKKIYLVTDQQQPHWLDEAKRKQLDLEVVDHRAIFEGYLAHLPSFNSLAIEAMLHRIPGIADRFLYFNDDVVLLKKTKESDYFDHGYSIYRGEWVWKRKLKEKIAGYLPLTDFFKSRWIGKGFLGYGNEERYFKLKRNRLFRLAHAPHPLQKHVLEQIFKDRAVIEKQVAYRFKNKQQYIPASLAANQAFLSKQAKKGPKDYGYISCNDLNLEQVNGWLDYFDKSNHIKSLCIQSLDQASPEMEERIKAYLNERLNVYG